MSLLSVERDNTDCSLSLHGFETSDACTCPMRKANKKTIKTIEERELYILISDNNRAYSINIYFKCEYSICYVFDCMPL